MLQRLTTAVMAVMLALVCVTSVRAESDPAVADSVSADTLLDVKTFEEGTAKADDKTVPLYRSPRRLNTPAHTITAEYDLGESIPNNTTFEELASEITGFMATDNVTPEDLEIEIWSWADTVRYRGTSPKTSDVLNAALAKDRGEDLRREIMLQCGIPLGNMDVMSSTDGPARVAEIRIYPKQVKVYQSFGSAAPDSTKPIINATYYTQGSGLALEWGARSWIGPIRGPDANNANGEGVLGVWWTSGHLAVFGRGSLGSSGAFTWGAEGGAGFTSSRFHAIAGVTHREWDSFVEDGDLNAESQIRVGGLVEVGWHFWDGLNLAGQLIQGRSEARGPIEYETTSVVLGLSAYNWPL